MKTLSSSEKLAHTAITEAAKYADYLSPKIRREIALAQVARWIHAQDPDHIIAAIKTADAAITEIHTFYDECY